MALDLLKASMRSVYSGGRFGAELDSALMVAVPTDKGSTGLRHVERQEVPQQIICFSCQDIRGLCL